MAFFTVANVILCECCNIDLAAYYCCIKITFSDAIQSLKKNTQESAALEEMVQNLSQQKVDHVTEIERLRNDAVAAQKSNEESLKFQEETLKDL